MPSLDSKAAQAELWRRGNLSWLLRPAQLEAYRHLRTGDSTHTVAALHRGAGKSYLAAVIAVEEGRRGRHVKYVGPNIKMVERIATPHFKQVLASCPTELLPKFREGKGLIEFPSGGTIIFGAADRGHADSLRGTDTHLAILDEEGFFTDPDYLIVDVLQPRALPVDGRFLHISTPPTSPSHPFGQRMRNAAREGYLYTLPVTENPDVTEEKIRQYEKESGGKHTTAYRREYLCELCTEEKDAVIPEVIHTPLGREAPTDMTIPFVGLSIDMQGLSAAVIGVYSLDSRHLTVTDEVVLERTNSTDFARSVTPRIPPKAVRVGNVADQMQADFASKHGLAFSYRKLSGEHLKSRINRVRTLVAENRLSVLAPWTRRHVEDAVWNESRSYFGNSGDGGCFDALLALALVAGELPGDSRYLANHPIHDFDTYYQNPIGSSNKLFDSLSPVRKILKR